MKHRSYDRVPTLAAVRFLSVLLLTAAHLVGCGASDISGADAGSSDASRGDAGLQSDVCRGAANGALCGSGGVCIAEACVTSRCGDGATDSRTGEECDDGNDVFADGCESNCRFTCHQSDECDDGDPCNGAEECGSARLCVRGEPFANGAPCSTTSHPGGVCRAGQCAEAGCGNSVVDGTDECDDGNTDEGDGCDNDCTFSCHDDLECSDGDACTGVETCTLASHTCSTGTAVTCDPPDACTNAACDRDTGECVFTLIDEDGDGYASVTLGTCGDDCIDTRDDVHPGATEQCDGIDHDCDGDPDPLGLPIFYMDCDGDGFASASAESTDYCDPTGSGNPPPPSASCPGGWTAAPPNSPNNIDCDDTDPDAYPGQTMWFTSAAMGGGYDYNCINGMEMRYTTSNISSDDTCTINRIMRGCIGAAGWTSSMPAACGGTATYSRCQYYAGLCSGGTCTPPSCGRVNGSRTQECR